jgi:inward rectifier potassium channel
LATGLLYGRFARPLAKIIYSEKAIIAPFKDMNAFQFRIANLRSDHQMVDVEVELMFSRVEKGMRKVHDLNWSTGKLIFSQLHGPSIIR